MKVFITGASSGLGKSLVDEFVSLGYIVWGIGRRALVEGKNKFYYSTCNISKESDMKLVYDKIQNEDFIPDIVILNAGVMKEDLPDGFSYPILQKRTCR